MKRARARALTLVVALLAGAAALTALIDRKPPAPPDRPPQERPALLVLTSLPLVFSEQFSLEGGGSPALTALERRYRVVPISIADDLELSKGRLLLMAQPRPQPAENLVTLDRWVQGGGRVLLLADPMLEWPSALPLGDPLRPSPMYMDTGLLAHWGLRLDSPDRRGPLARQLGPYDVLAVSPGRLSGNCEIGPDGLVAHCRLGKGRATVVADADILNVERGEARTEKNLAAVLSELASLEHP